MLEVGRVQWCPAHLLNSPHHSHHVGRSSVAAAPHADVVGRDALYNADVEVAEDLRLYVKVPQPQLCPLNQLCPSMVLTDVDTQVFKAALPLHCKHP